MGKLSRSERSSSGRGARIEEVRMFTPQERKENRMNDTAMKFDLQLFADPSAALNNTSGTMTAEMKTFYEKRLIDHPAVEYLSMLAKLKVWMLRNMPRRRLRAKPVRGK